MDMGNTNPWRLKINFIAASYTIGGKLPGGCWEEVLAALSEVEAEMGAKLGDGDNPLLLSVRSGAAVSTNLNQFVYHPPSCVQTVQEF